MSIKSLVNSSSISALIAFTIVMADRYIFEPAIYANVSLATMFVVTAVFAIAIDVVTILVRMLIATLHAEWRTHRAQRSSH